jgi:thymidylate synthase ThyX
MRQLVRQRTAKLNENSGRYSVMPKLFYRADVSRLCKQSRENKQGTGTEPLTEDEIHEYELNREISLQAASCHYDAAMDAGLARETARNELPLSTYTYLYWKIDMRNMFNLLAKRCEDDAQYEYRCYANVFAGIVQRLCPLAFEAFQDYEQGAATFTQAELAALPAYYLAHCHLREPSELTRQFINDILAQGGVAPTKSGKESREQAEFWAKLKPRAKRSYELDPATAKDASFYEKLMEANA